MSKHILKFRNVEKIMARMSDKEQRRGRARNLRTERKVAACIKSDDALTYKIRVGY